MFPIKNTQPDQCIKTREKQCRQKPQLAGVDLLGLPIIENPFQNVLPSVFADSLMIIGPDGADSQRSQGDRKIGKDERPPSLFYDNPVYLSNRNILYECFHRFIRCKA